MKKSHKSLLIFDLDGTLIDSVADLAAATNGALADFQLPQASEAQVRSWVGNGSVKLIERALAAQGGARVDAAAAHERFLWHYKQVNGSKTALYDGVAQGLKALQQAGFALALVTNKSAQFLPAILQRFDWQDLFVVVLGGDSLPTKKPDAAPLLHACNALKISADAAAMIGDSKNDILAAKAAQMTALALSYGYNYDEPIAHSHPDAVFDEFGELVDFILANFYA